MLGMFNSIAFKSRGRDSIVYIGYKALCQSVNWSVSYVTPLLISMKKITFGAGRKGKREERKRRHFRENERRGGSRNVEEKIRLIVLDYSQLDAIQNVSSQSINLSVGWSINQSIS